MAVGNILSKHFQLKAALQISKFNCLNYYHYTSMALSLSLSVSNIHYRVYESILIQGRLPFFCGIELGPRNGWTTWRTSSY